jgi:hypothetical protein
MKARDSSSRQSFEPGLALHGRARAGVSLPSDPGKIPAFRLAGSRKGCNPAFGY